MRGLLRRFLLPSLLLAVIAPTSTYAVLERVGPINTAPSVGNFPAWYQDTTGLTLEFCDPKTQAEADGGWCLFVLGDVTAPETFPTNFFDEHFWYAADSGIDNTIYPNFPLKKAILVTAVEAAFGGGLAKPGDQVAFARIRIRLEDVPVSGTYRFIHPYGEEIVDALAGDRIFVTDDVGIACPPGNFDCALTSRLGPFLLPSNTPGGGELPPVTGPSGLYIADPNRDGPVTGSALPDFIDSTGATRNHNIFRIEGPVGSNLDGDGNDFIETINFTLMGRIYQGPIPGRIEYDRASYTRNTSGMKLDVYANGEPTTNGRLPGQPRPSAAQPTLSFFRVPCAGVADPDTGEIGPPFSAPLGATEFPLSRAGSNYFGQTALDTIPATICMKDAATDIGGNPAPVFTPKVVTDEVTITKAFFNKASGILSVEATSSDSTVPPILTLGGFGELTSGSINVSPLVAPPNKAQVLSSAGGVAEYLVTTNAATVAPATGLVLVTNLPSPQPSGTPVMFVAAGQGSTAGYEYRFWMRNLDIVGSTFAIVQDWSTASTWTWPTNLIAGTYRIFVNVRTGSSVTGDVSGAINFVISPPVAPATGASITTDKPSPQVQGTPVTFTATGSGGTPPYQYRFWMRNLDVAGSTYALMQDWSTTSTWTWPPDLVPGTYRIFVNVRAGNAGNGDTDVALNFVITPPL